MSQMLIVHPTDLMATSEAAFDHALKLGLVEHSRLAVVHAHGYDTEEAPTLDDFPHVRATLRRWGLLAEDAPETAVGEKLGVYVSKGEILTADPEAGLAKLLQDRQAGMIVLGTRGLQGFERLVKGSFSERLARDAKIPALFVPNDADGFVDSQTGEVRLRNVLIPIAQAPDASAAITVARQLARDLAQTPRFHLLHVGHPGSTPERPAGEGEWDVLLRQGPVVETIVAVAEEVQADLIVMATAGHKGFLDALRGSTTEEVLRKAHRALLAIPAVETPPPAALPPPEGAAARA